MRISSLTAICLASAGLLLGTGCEGTQAPPQQAADPAPSNARTNAPRGDLSLDSGVPQEKLPTIKLWIGPETVTAEMAGTNAQIRKGMMFRTEMGEHEGMIFVFPRPHQTAFYMKNTLIPLSCAYIDPEGEIIEIHDMTPKEETPIEAGSDSIQYVLEMRQGWFDEHNISPGMKIGTERGTLRETFFGRR